LIRARTLTVWKTKRHQPSRARFRNVKQYLSWITLHHADGTDRKKQLSRRSGQKARAIFQGIIEHGREIEVIDVHPTPKEKTIDKPARRTPLILGAQAMGKPAVRVRDARQSKDGA
jgi:hypothetical protein